MQEQFFIFCGSDVGYECHLGLTVDEINGYILKNRNICDIVYRVFLYPAASGGYMAVENDAVWEALYEAKLRQALEIDEE